METFCELYDWLLFQIPRMHSVRDMKMKRKSQYLSLSKLLLSTLNQNHQPHFLQRNQVLQLVKLAPSFKSPLAVLLYALCGYLRKSGVKK